MSGVTPAQPCRAMSDSEVQRAAGAGLCSCAAGMVGQGAGATHDSDHSARHEWSTTNRQLRLSWTDGVWCPILNLVCETYC